LRDRHNNIGLKNLNTAGISKYHLLEKGIKKFKVEPGAEKSRLEGNTLILGKDHYQDTDHEKLKYSLNNLLNNTRESHLSTKANNAFYEMHSKANQAAREGKPNQHYIDASKRWLNMSEILKTNPERGIKIIKHLSKLHKSNQKPKLALLDMLLDPSNKKYT